MRRILFTLAMFGTSMAFSPMHAKAGWKPNPVTTMTKSTRLGCGEPGYRYVVPKVPHVPQRIVNAFDKHMFMIGRCRPAHAPRPVPRRSK